MTLNEFLGSKFRNHYVYEEGLSIYMRQTKHFLDVPVLEPTLDIANVNVIEESRGHGIFTAFLERVEREAADRNRAVLVENLHNKRLHAFLVRRGYVETIVSHEVCPTVFRRIPREKAEHGKSKEGSQERD